MSKRVRALALAACLLLTLLAGCAKEQSGGVREPAPSAPEQGKQVIFASTMGEQTLDPVDGYASWYAVRYGVLETLFRFDEKMQAQPWLAETYQMLDGSTWRITIRQGIAFSNGVELTAQAVADALDYCRRGNERIEEVIRTATLQADGQVLTIKTRQPSPTLISELANPFCAILDVHSGTDFATNPIGTGPFVIESFLGKSICRLQENKTYWDGPSPLDSLSIKVIADADALTLMMQNGEIDWGQGISAENISLFEDNEEYCISTVPTSRLFMGYVNLKNEHLAKEGFRRAIAMAMDKDSFCTNLLSGSSTPSDACFPSSLPYGGKAVSGQDYTLEGAKQLLQHEGYVLTAEGRLTWQGQPVTMRIIGATSRVEIPLLAEGVASKLMELGIETQVINASDDPTAILESGDFEIGLYSRISLATGDPYAFLSSCLGTGGYANYSGYSNPTVDALLSELAVEFDTERRAQLATQIQQLAVDDNAILNFCHLNLSMVTSSDVTGVTSHPTDYYQVTNRIDVNPSEKISKG